MICKNPNFSQGGGNGLPPPPLKPPLKGRIRDKRVTEFG